MAEPFKERINGDVVRSLGAALAAARPSFPEAAFLAAALDGLEALELMDRVRHLARALAAHLPPDFPSAVATLLEVLGPPADPEAPEASTRAAAGLSGFAMLAATRFVADAGLGHPALALDALRQMTSRFSAEFDVRPFLARHPALTWATLEAFCADPDPHVRRLASEGSRPYLPWGVRVPALVADPAPGLALLERLVDDPSPYVRRSVANHLNDVARAHPQRVLELARRWGVDASPERQALVRHGLRGLLKRGHPEALALLGFDPAVGVRLRDLEVPAQAVLGQRLSYRFGLVAEVEGPALVDLVLHRPLARGRGRLVRRISQRRLAAGVLAEFSPVLDLRPVTTRRDRPGIWRLEIQVNGVVLGGADLEVLPVSN